MQHKESIENQHRAYFYSEWATIYQNIIQTLSSYESTPNLIQFVNTLDLVNLNIFEANGITNELYLALTNIADVLSQMNLKKFADQIEYILSPICNTSTEVLATELAEQYLSSRDISSLMCTASFFATDDSLHQARKINYAKRWNVFENSAPSCWVDSFTNQVYDFKYLFAQTKEDQQIQGMLRLLPSKLKANETPKQIIKTSWHLLILTNKNRILHLSGYGTPFFSDQFIELPQNEIIEEIFHSNKHFLIRSKNNNLYGFGENQRGQLGLGHCQEVNSPQLIPLQIKPKQVVVNGGMATAGSSFVLCENNVLYGFGGNEKGQLGFVGIEYCHSPKKINLPAQEIVEKIIHTIEEERHCLFVLSKSGKLYGMGLLPSEITSLAGIPIADTKYSYPPTLIPLPFNELPEQILIEFSTVFIQCQGGKIYVIDGASSKQNFIPQCLELPNSDLPQDMILRGHRNSLILSKSGKIYELKWVENKYELLKVELPNNDTACKIIANHGDTIILCATGNLYGFEAKFLIKDKEDFNEFTCKERLVPILLQQPQPKILNTLDEGKEDNLTFKS